MKHRHRTVIDPAHALAWAGWTDPAAPGPAGGPALKEASTRVDWRSGDGPVAGLGGGAKLLLGLAVACAALACVGIGLAIMAAAWLAQPRPQKKEE